MRRLFFLLGFLLCSGEALSQTALNFNNAYLFWSAETTTGVDGFRMKCGRKPAVYTQVTTIPGPAIRSVLASKVITGDGVWYCAVCAYTKLAEMPMSKEVMVTVVQIK